MMVELHTSSKIKRNLQVAVGVHVYVYNLVRFSTLGSTFFSLNPCITVLSLQSIADTWQHFHLFFNACTKGYVVNSCLIVKQ